MCALCAGKRLKYHIMNTVSLPGQPVTSLTNISKYVHNCHCVAFDLIFMPRRHLFYGFIMWGESYLASGFQSSTAGNKLGMRSKTSNGI